MVRGAQGALRGGLTAWVLLSGLSTASAQQVVTRGNLTVSYQDASDARHLPLVFGTFEKAARDLKALGLMVPRVNLIAASNAADFAHQTGEPVSIAASTRGNTIYTQRLTALAGRGILADTIRHETFHTAQPATLPRWLAEGLARVFSGESQHDPAGHTGLEDLSDAQLNDRLLGRAPGEAGQAYAEASRRARALLQKVGWPGALKR